MVSNGLMNDGEVYRWFKSLSDLKIFVKESLNINGKWFSPGGDVKLFKSDGEGELVIKWHGSRSKRISIQSDNQEQYLKLKFESLANQCQTNAEILHETGNIIAHSPELAVSSCVNESFVTQLGSLRLDIASLESRFNGELVSQINSLQTKQNDLESIVRKQDEIIWKLNDDNLLLKSRLLSLEKLITKMNENGPENNSLIPISNYDDFITIVDDQPNDSKFMFENSPSSISEISIPKDSLTIVQDQPTVSNLSPSLLVNAETPRANNRDCREETAAEQSAPSTTSLVIGDKPNKVHKPNKDRSTNTLQGETGKPRDYANIIPNQLAPKHLTPCPFLKRRGFCLKGPSCDFLHNNPRPRKVSQRPFQNSADQAPPPLPLPFFPQPNYNHFPFPVDPRHFPPFQFPTYHSMFRPLPYPPPLMSLPTSSLLYPPQHHLH